MTHGLLQGQLQNIILFLNGCGTRPCPPGCSHPMTKLVQLLEREVLLLFGSLILTYSRYTLIPYYHLSSNTNRCPGLLDSHSSRVKMPILGRSMVDAIMEAIPWRANWTMKRTSACQRAHPNMNSRYELEERLVFANMNILK